MAEVLITEEALEDLQDLDRAVQVQVLRALLNLEKSPELRGSRRSGATWAAISPATASW
jgi:mRNA-degrading endonuclease RelE of RelBE toxin-antitoxin system